MAVISGWREMMPVNKVTHSYVQLQGQVTKLGHYLPADPFLGFFNLKGNDTPCHLVSYDFNEMKKKKKEIKIKSTTMSQSLK